MAEFMEIETASAIYRFYGRGDWRMQNEAGEFRPVNAVYVPATVLRTAIAVLEQETPAPCP